MEYNAPTAPMQGIITTADEAEPTRTLRYLIDDPATAENIYQWLIGSGWFEQSQHGRTFRAREALDRQQAALDSARAALDNLDDQYAAVGPVNADSHHNRAHTDSQSHYQSHVEFDSQAPHSPGASTDILSEIEVQQENDAPRRYATRDRYDDYERDQPAHSTTSSSKHHEPFVGEPAVHRSGHVSYASSRNDGPYENNGSNTQPNRASIQPAAQYYTSKRSTSSREGGRYDDRERSPYRRLQQVAHVATEQYEETIHAYPTASHSYDQQHRRSSVVTTLAGANTNFPPRHDNYDEYDQQLHPQDGRRSRRSRSPEYRRIPARESYSSYREREPSYSPVLVPAPAPAVYTPAATEVAANAGRGYVASTAVHHDGADRAVASTSTVGKQAGPNQPQDRDPQKERENMMAPVSFNAGQPGGKSLFYLFRLFTPSTPAFTLSSINVSQCYSKLTTTVRKSSWRAYLTDKLLFTASLLLYFLIRYGIAELLRLLYLWGLWLAGARPATIVRV